MGTVVREKYTIVPMEWRLEQEGTNVVVKFTGIPVDWWDKNDTLTAMQYFLGCLNCSAKDHLKYAPGPQTGSDEYVVQKGELTVAVVCPVMAVVLARRMQKLWPKNIVPGCEIDGVLT